MEWEKVILKKPELTVKDCWIYCNSVFREEIGKVEGLDFYKAKRGEVEILSCKPGKKFRFCQKEDKKIICKGLVELINLVYGGANNFILDLDGGYYILEPKK